MVKPQSLRLTLTPEQREQIRQQTGRDAEALEFPIQELERLGPSAPGDAKKPGRIHAFFTQG